MGYKKSCNLELQLFFLSIIPFLFVQPQLFPRVVLSINKKIPAKSQDFQEPKTKIYETFYLQPIFMATGLYL